MKLLVENVINKIQDDSIITAIKNSIMPTDTIDSLWNDLQKCKFDNHILGRGGSHIWIKNRSNISDRIAIITE